MNSAQYAQLVEAGSHPPWCAGGHHCTAAFGGEHASVQEVWAFGSMRLYARRHQRYGRRTGTVELRFEVPLPDADDPAVADWLRRIVAATVAASGR